MRSQTRTSPPRCLCFLGTLSFSRVNVIHRSRRSLRVQRVCVCVRNNGIDTPCFEYVLDLLSFSVNKPPLAHWLLRLQRPTIYSLSLDSCFCVRLVKKALVASRFTEVSLHCVSCDRWLMRCTWFMAVCFNQIATKYYCMVRRVTVSV